MDENRECRALSVSTSRLFAAVSSLSPPLARLAAPIVVCSLRPNCQRQLFESQLQATHSSTYFTRSVLLEVNFSRSAETSLTMVVCLSVSVSLSVSVCVCLLMSVRLVCMAARHALSADSGCSSPFMRSAAFAERTRRHSQHTCSHAV